jgi:type IV pilus assembly protein PilW
MTRKIPIICNPAQQGLTLVEIMVALTLSLIIIGGVSQVYLSNKTSQRLLESLSVMQENGRYAVKIISDDIKEGDFWACASNSSKVTNSLNSNGSSYVDISSGGVTGTDDSGLNGSDTLSLRGAFGNGINLSTSMAAKTSALQVAVPNNLDNLDLVFVSDCTSGDLFQISSGDPDTTGVLNHAITVGTPGNASASLSTRYETDALIHPFREVTYSIQTGANGLPALFRSTNGAGAVELIEGVEDMQVTYGEDTNGDYSANRYLPAGSAGLNMNRVVSIRVVLTLISLQDNVASQTNNGDNRIRRTFSTTTVLRNRVS